MKIKKVELYELFYDLVFVYAISNMTSLIHHLHNGVIGGYDFFKFMFCFLILMNTWMTKTVYINRYGRLNSFKTFIFILIDVCLMLILANTFKIEKIDDMFIPFVLVSGLLAITLIIQYYLSSLEHSDEKNRNLCKKFCIVLSVRATLLPLSALFPLNIGLIIAIIGILSSFILPGFISKHMVEVSVNFPHIVERISLLVIILFGEMLISISEYFNVEKLGINSFLIFSITTSLFFFYTTFTFMINHHREKETAVKYIYLHYPIFLGTSFITVSLSMFNHESNHLFIVGLIYFSLFMFYMSMYLLSIYLDKKYLPNKKLISYIILIYAIGLVTSLIFRENYNIVILSTAVITNILTIVLYKYYLRITNV